MVGTGRAEVGMGRHRRRHPPGRHCGVPRDGHRAHVLGRDEASLGRVLHCLQSIHIIGIAVLGVKLGDPCQQHVCSGVGVVQVLCGTDILDVFGAHVPHIDGTGGEVE